MAKQIAIKPCRWAKPFQGTNPHFEVTAWLKAPPFAVNKRGVLVHRVRHVTTHMRYGSGGWAESHHSMHYLCGNGCCFELGSEDETLVSDPPKDRLLCEACERVAARQKLPTGDKLAGRHVHRGILKPHQTCCGGSAS